MRIKSSKSLSSTTRSIGIGIFVGLIISFILRRISYSSCQSWGFNGRLVDIDKDIPDPAAVISAPLFEDVQNRLSTLAVQAHKNTDHAFPVHLDLNKRSKVATQNSDYLNSTTKPKKLVLIGVITAQKYLRTRALSIAKTWGQDMPGNILYFTGENHLKNQDLKASKIMEKIPVVILPGVDDSYPPQKKSFMMLKYMFEHYGDQYEWFMRADDDLYIRTDSLERFLRSVNSNKSYFIGRAGIGKVVERGRLHLNRTMNYCMGGPGIIFSRQTLEMIVPHFNACLRNAYSTHEDVELGRCVQRYAQLNCTWSYEMSNLFYHNPDSLWHNFGSLKIDEAITLHPFKNHRSVFQLHSFFLGLKIQELLTESVKLDNDLQYYMQTISRQKLEQEPADLYGNSSKGSGKSVNISAAAVYTFSPSQIAQVLNWNFINRSRNFYTFESVNPKAWMNTASKENLNLVIREMLKKDSHSEIVNSKLEVKDVLYGYHRINPLYGEDYILNLVVTNSKARSQPGLGRLHANLQRAFGPTQWRFNETPRRHSPRFSTLKSIPKINVIMVLPLSGRLQIFKHFLHNFLVTSHYFASQETQIPLSLKLIVVHFINEKSEKENVTTLVNSCQGLGLKYLTCNDTIKLVHREGEFSRGIALDYGISQCSDNDLIFIIDVDFIFTSAVITRVFRNTIQGERVYFPIVFSLYHTKFSKPIEVRERKMAFYDVSAENGYWRDGGYGIGSFYKSDYSRIGGYDLTIKGWGKEDVLLFEKFVRSNLTIFRPTDPELIHIFHVISCDKKLSRVQYEMCLGSQAGTLGSTARLMKYIFENRNRSRHMEKVCNNVI